MKTHEIKAKEVTDRLVDFIRTTVGKNGFSKVILGLSGGIDSSVVAYLSCRALGNNNVIGAIMPYGKSSQQDVEDAYLVARALKIETEHVDISRMIDAYFAKIKDVDPLRQGNKMARERMSILYDLSKRYKALVIGTSNRTERLLGYGTLYGDMACALNPIGNLYKTQIKALAQFLKVPSKIIQKIPTAGLWPGQTDENELGYCYADIDRLFFLMVDKRLTNRALLGKGFKQQFISDIRGRIRRNRFKLLRPLIAQI